MGLVIVNTPDAPPVNGHATNRDGWLDAAEGTLRVLKEEGSPSLAAIETATRLAEAQVSIARLHHDIYLSEVQQ